MGVFRAILVFWDYLWSYWWPFSEGGVTGVMGVTVSMRPYIPMWGYSAQFWYFGLMGTSRELSAAIVFYMGVTGGNSLLVCGPTYLCGGIPRNFGLLEFRSYAWELVHLFMELSEFCSQTSSQEDEGF